MSHRLPTLALAAVFILLAATASAAPIVIDFASGGPVGMQGTALTASGVVAEGFSRTAGGNWVPVPLFRRNEPNDHGLGVCSEGDAACGSGCGLGDWNELSNNANPELIRLTLPNGYRWTAFQLSSLDGNLGTLNRHEVGQVFADDDASFGSPGALSPNRILGYEWAGGTVEPLFAMPAAFASSRHLLFEAYHFDNPSEIDNDYLLWKVELVPEPSTILLIGLGLGLRRLRRRTR